MCHGAAITKKRASPVPTRNSRQRRHSPVTARYIKAAPPGNASAIKPFVKTPSAIHAYPAYQRQESARDSRAVKKKYNGAAIRTLSSTSGIRIRVKRKTPAAVYTKRAA